MISKNERLNDDDDDHDEDNDIIITSNLLLELEYLVAFHPE